MGETPEEVNFSTVGIWVQLHGLPLGHSTNEMARWAAGRLGEVLEVDFRSNRLVWVTQYIRVKVAVKVD